MGGGVLMMIELNLNPGFSYLQLPLSRTGHLHFLVICPRFPLSLAGLNAQARTGLDVFKDRRLVFQGKVRWLVCK